MEKLKVAVLDLSSSSKPRNDKSLYSVLHRRSTFSQALHQAPQGYESIKEYLYIHLVQEALNIRGGYLITLPYTNSSLSVSDRGDRRVATGRALGKNINITPPCSVSPGTQLRCSVGGDCPPAPLGRCLGLLLLP